MVAVSSSWLAWLLGVSPRSYEQLLAKMTSKLNSELVTKAVDDILAYSAGETIKKGDVEIVGKKRKFTESIELQVTTFFPVQTRDTNMETHTPT